MLERPSKSLLLMIVTDMEIVVVVLREDFLAYLHSLRTSFYKGYALPTDDEHETGMTVLALMTSFLTLIQLTSQHGKVLFRDKPNRVSVTDLFV